MGIFNVKNIFCHSERMRRILLLSVCYSRPEDNYNLPDNTEDGEKPYDNISDNEKGKEYAGENTPHKK